MRKQLIVAKTRYVIST